MGDIAGGGQGALRLGVFLAVCLGLGLWEAWWPRRGDARRGVRWPVNLSLAVVNSVIVRVLAPASGVTFALLAEGRGLGLLRAVTWPGAVEFALAVLVLDAAVYLQHRLFHVVPLLWKVHRLHHADRGFDFTTGVRFHPGEIAISTVYKGACIIALGRRRRPRWRSRSSSAPGRCFPTPTRGWPAIASGGCCSSRPTCTACTTPPTASSRTPTSASASRGGTGSEAPTGRRRSSRTKRCRSGSTRRALDMLLTMPRAIHTRPHRSRKHCLLLVTVLLTWGCSSPERVAEAPAPPKPLPWELSLTPGTLATGAMSMGPQLTSSPNGTILSWLEQNDDTSPCDTPSGRPMAMVGTQDDHQGTDWFVSAVDVPAVLRLRDGSLAAEWLKAVDLAPEAYDALSLSRATTARRGPRPLRRITTAPPRSTASCRCSSGPRHRAAAWVSCGWTDGMRRRRRDEPVQRPFRRRRKQSSRAPLECARVRVLPDQRGHGRRRSRGRLPRSQRRGRARHLRGARDGVDLGRPGPVHRRHWHRRLPRERAGNRRRAATRGRGLVQAPDDDGHAFVAFSRTAAARSACPCAWTTSRRSGMSASCCSTTARPWCPGWSSTAARGSGLAGWIHPARAGHRCGLPAAKAASSAAFPRVLASGRCALSSPGRKAAARSPGATQHSRDCDGSPPETRERVTDAVTRLHGCVTHLQVLHRDRSTGRALSARRAPHPSPSRASPAACSAGGRAGAAAGGVQAPVAITVSASCSEPSIGSPSWASRSSGAGQSAGRPSK